jgi:hypothetical protein
MQIAEWHQFELGLLAAMAVKLLLGPWQFFFDQACGPDKIYRTKSSMQTYALITVFL